VRRSYDPSMHLCTAHISQYSEVADDSSSITEAVGQDTCKNLQLAVLLGTVASPQHRSQHVRTSRLHHKSRSPPKMPQHNPVAENEAKWADVSRIIIPEHSEDSGCSISEPQEAAESGQGSAVQPIISLSHFLTPRAPPQVEGSSSVQIQEAYAAEKVKAPHTSAAQAPPNPVVMKAYARYLRPSRGGGAVANGSKDRDARDESSVHAVPCSKPPSQKTWPGTIWDATPIVFVSLMLLLGSILVVLFLSGAFR
jgi:hypothetical protein